MARDPNEIAQEFKTAVANLDSARRRFNAISGMTATVRLGSELREDVSIGLRDLAKAEIMVTEQARLDAAEVACADLAAEAVEAFPK